MQVLSFGALFVVFVCFFVFVVFGDDSGGRYASDVFFLGCEIGTSRVWRLMLPSTGSSSKIRGGLVSFFCVGLVRRGWSSFSPASMGAAVSV